MNNSKEILIARDLCKEYLVGKNKVAVLKNISLSLNQSDFVVITGPSGVGKTTLLNCLSGMDNFTSGDVEVAGQNMSRMSPKDIARLRNKTFGMIFQFYYLMSDLNALENVMITGAIYKSMSVKDLKTRATHYLTDLGLANRLHHYPSQLSGGEMQRVAIARALVNEPDILFCDEPTGNLDSNRSHEIMLYLRQLADVYKKTIIIVTHDDTIASNANVWWHMKDGQIFEKKEKVNGN